MTFDETPMNPADIAAMTEFAPVRRTKKAGGQRLLVAQKNNAASPLIAEGQNIHANQFGVADRTPKASGRKHGSVLLTAPLAGLPIANATATYASRPNDFAPLVSNPKVGNKANTRETTKIGSPLADPPIPHATNAAAQPTVSTPHSGYQPTPAITETVDAIINMHRLRQGMIKAATKLKLQAMASIRFAVHEDGDYDSDESKAKARKKADALYRDVEADPAHSLHGHILPYLAALGPLDAQRATYEKELVKLVKRLPVYEWAKAVKGFGDVSFATIVGECGDIGTYRNPSCVWKRMGLAVFDGKRQGAPGEGATAADWVVHGYSKVRRSVSWNMRNNLIGGMGKYRPLFGEDVRANPELTELQCVFVERARYESEKLGLPVTCSDKNKESYKKHPTNRAMRYTEKRLLRELYSAWRRA